jgi:WD40 repeat protein
LDLEARAQIMEQRIPFDRPADEIPSVEFSPDGRLLACVTTQEARRAVVIFDRLQQKERYRLPLSLHPVFSPDGKLLATRQEDIGREYTYIDRLQLWDSETGNAIQDVELKQTSIGWRATPRFSSDGKYVAVGVQYQGDGWIQVIETASGKTSFWTKGWSPQFLSGNALLGIRESTRPLNASPREKVQELVVWSSDRWKEKRTFPYDLGLGLSGPLSPEPWVTENGHAIALLYDTGGWSGSTKSSITSFLGLWRALDLNLPRGLGLDIIDHRTGVTQTYHLDPPSLYPYRPFRLPRVGKLLIPKEGEVAEVWDLPPQRTYASVKWMAGVLAAIGLLWYTVAATWRGVAKLRRARVGSV